MYDRFSREELLQALDRLIERNAAVLEDEEDELRQVRGSWLTLALKEHILGSLSEEENERRHDVLSRFKELQSRVDAQGSGLQRLRAVRKEWEIELPSSLHDELKEMLAVE